MKEFRGLLLVSALLMVLCVSTAVVYAETTYTWEYAGGSASGTQENGMYVMHHNINEQKADGETNYADLYCALQIPPSSFPADKELALKVKLYGNVIRNDNNRGIYMNCDVKVAPSGLDRDATLNAGYSMTPDDYNALSWGNYAGGFGDNETVVRRNMSRSGYSEGDTISIYLRTSFGQCEWKYKLVKSGSGSDDSGNSKSGTAYIKYGKGIYSIKNNKAAFFYHKSENSTSITVPATIKYKGKTIPVTEVYNEAFKGMKKLKTVTIGKNVKKIGKNAFKGSKATKIILKTKKLTKKASVKGALKESKIKTVQVKVGKKSVNKKYVKKYKKVFTKKNAGKKVKVKI